MLSFKLCTQRTAADGHRFEGILQLRLQLTGRRLMVNQMEVKVHATQICGFLENKLLLTYKVFLLSGSLPFTIPGMPTTTLFF